MCSAVCGPRRGDLAERLLPIEMEVIPDHDRRGEKAVWADYDERQARILGAILDLAVQVLQRLPTIGLDSKPRMADFAQILAAVDSVLGTSGLEHYLARQKALAIDSLTENPFLIALLGMTAGFHGTSAELLEKLTPLSPPKGWPTQPRNVTTILKRNGSALRRAGWTFVDDGGNNQANAIRWLLTPPDIDRNSSSSNSFPASNYEQASYTRIECKESQDDRCLHCDGEGCAWCLSNDPIREVRL